MAVAPLIAMKSTKCESLEAVGRELDRRAHTYANDIDQSGRHIGYVCRAGDEHPMPLERAVERRMGELNTKRAVRKDAVKAMGFIVSSNDALDEKTAREFLDKAVRWFGARYGYVNLLAAHIHLDEGTPHAHIWVAPVMRGADGYDRLCAKELFAPDKRRRNKETGKWEVVAQGTMSQLQQDFWRDVASKYGYERPLDHTKRAKGYRSLEAFKTHEGVTRELRAETVGLGRRRDEARAELAEAKRRLEKVRRETAALEGQLRESERRAGELGRERDEARGRVQGLERRRDGLAARVGRLRQLVGVAATAVLSVAETAAGAVLEALGLDVGRDREPWALGGAPTLVRANGGPERAMGVARDGMDVLAQVRGRQTAARDGRGTWQR